MPKSSRPPSREMPTAVLDVELGLAEGRGDLVLDDFDPDPVADRLGPLLEGLDAADVEPLRGVELQRPAARLGLRRAELDADLFADLVGEEADGVGAVEVAGQFAHRLRHQAGLQADRLCRRSGRRARLSASAPRPSRSRRRRSPPRRSGGRRSAAPARRSRAGRPAARRCRRRSCARRIGSIACSVSMKAQIPPRAWASAMMW